MRKYGIYIIILWILSIIFLFYVNPMLAFSFYKRNLFFLYSFVFAFFVFFLAYINLEITVNLLKIIKNYLSSIDNENRILKEKRYYNFLENYYDSETKILFIFLFPFSLIFNYYYLNQDLKEIKNKKFKSHKSEVRPFLWLIFTFFAALFILPLIVSFRLLFSKGISEQISGSGLSI